MATKKKQILVCGITVLDFVHSVESMPDKAEKYVSHDSSIVIGGCAANASIAISRLGGSCRLLSRLGKDAIGSIIIEKLQAEKVDCSLLSISSAGSSPYSSILVDSNGERQIINYRGKSLALDTPTLDSDTEVDAILVDTRWDTGAIALLEAAHQRQIPGIVDAEEPVNARIIALASHTAFSRRGLQQFTGCETIEAGLRHAKANTKGWHCVTDGANGTYTLDGQTLLNIPAPRIQAVDTLGAGDVWHGAFTLHLASGHSELESIEYANTVAAIKCTRAGGGDGCPTEQDVKAFMQCG